MADWILPTTKRATGYLRGRYDPASDQYAIDTMLAQGKLQKHALSGTIVGIERKFLAKRRNQGQWGSCHDAETEVLTQLGWRLFADLKEDDALGTVNPASRDLMFERPTRLVRYHYVGPMVRVRNKSLDFKVTPDHQMVVRRWNESKGTLNDSFEFARADSLGWHAGFLGSFETSATEALFYDLPARPEDIFAESYAGDVFCAEVPSHHTLVTRRNGKVLVSGNCTGHGISGLLMAKCRENNNPAVLSARFPYYTAREYEKTVPNDEGAYVKDVVKCAIEYGVATEASCPYDWDRWSTLTRTPTQDAYKTARWHQANVVAARAYHPVYSLDAALQALANRMLLISGWNCYTSLAYATDSGHVPPWQGRGDALEGGHCTWFFEADTDARTLAFENSWGNDWGDDGVGYLPFAYLDGLGTSRSWSDDWWAISHEIWN